MRRRICFIYVMCLLLLMPALLWAADDGKEAAPGASYLIGPGDMLDIAVWKEEALTKTVVVLPDGMISFPLIGEVQAAGRTVAEVRKDIETRIGPFVKEVTLNVEVRQINSLLIYVIGRVNNPGRQALNADVNVMQALAAAGGLNPFAKRGKVKIFRHESKQTKVFNFDYDDVSEGKHLEQNIILKRGDVIVVP